MRLLRRRRDRASRHRLGVALLGAALVALTPACKHDSPSQSDVLPEAYLAYPGAVEIQGERTWEPEETGRDIHGSDLSSPATLAIGYKLDRLVDRETLWAWFDEQLVERGWAHGIKNDENTRVHKKQVGDRQHRMYISAGAEVREFSVTYQIGHRGEEDG